MVIGPKTVVTLTYTLSVAGKDGTASVLETRGSDNPVEFIFGLGVLLPAVEKNLEKKSMGYKTTLVLPPQDAFGEFHPEMEKWYDAKKLPRDTQPKVGMKFQTQGPSGEVISVLVKEVSDGKVLLDGNHPLAGATIEFELEVVRVRTATDEEILSGQVQSRLH